MANDRTQDTPPFDIPATHNPVLTLEHAALIRAWDSGFTAEDQARWCSPDRTDPVTGQPFLTPEATRMLLEVWDAEDRRSVTGG